MHTTSGEVTSVEIVDSGSNYKVGDKTVSNMEGTGSSIQSIAEVKSVVGVGISHISFKENVVENISIEFRDNGLIVGTSTLPHNLKNSDILEFYNSSPSLSELDGKSQIAITNFKTSLSVGIGNTVQTGMTTSLIVNNNVFDIVKRERLQVNDYLGINDEKVKILGFNSENNALIVERGQLSTIGAGITHVVGSDIVLDSRQILFSKNIRNIRNVARSRQFYFNPPEVVGLGVVGISTFNSYVDGSNYLKTNKIQSIYIKDHKFNTEMN